LTKGERGVCNESKEGYMLEPKIEGESIVFRFLTDDDGNVLTDIVCPVACGKCCEYWTTIPEFKNEDEERTFWAEHDSADYLDWSEAKRVIFPKLKPSTKTISLRMPESMLNELRLLANKRDVPYQSLIKVFLQERIDRELYNENA